MSFPKRREKPLSSFEEIAARNGIHFDKTKPYKPVRILREDGSSFMLDKTTKFSDLFPEMIITKGDETMSSKVDCEPMPGCSAEHKKYGTVTLVTRVETTDYSRIWIINDEQDELHLADENSLYDVHRYGE